MVVEFTALRDEPLAFDLTDGGRCSRSLINTPDRISKRSRTNLNRARVIVFSRTTYQSFFMLPPGSNKLPPLQMLVSLVVREEFLRI